jgi:hypothetical protein
LLLNLGEPHEASDGFDITPWADRVKQIDARYGGAWELPVIGAVAAPAAVLIRPDGYVAWVGGPSQPGLADVVRTACCGVAAGRVKFYSDPKFFNLSSRSAMSAFWSLMGGKRKCSSHLQTTRMTQRRHRLIRVLACLSQTPTFSAFIFCPTLGVGLRVRFWPCCLSL